MKKIFTAFVLGFAMMGCSQQPIEQGASAAEPPLTQQSAALKVEPSSQPSSATRLQKAPTQPSAPEQPTAQESVKTQADKPDMVQDDVNAQAAPSPEVQPRDVPKAQELPELAAKPQTDLPNQKPKLGPLTSEQLALLSSMTWDLPPEILDAVKEQNEGRHFLFSDEKHPELFYDSIKDLGGTYIGVGTDQGYLFTGWQKPELAFLIDYDPWVVILHHIYMTFWRVCPDSACLLDYFEDRKKGDDLLKSQDVRAKLASYGLKDRKLIFKVYRTANRNVARTLKKIQKLPQKTFMNDPDTFQYIKTLIETERLRSFQANLLGDRAFASIAKTLNDMNMSVTTLYLSNAEQYWGYTPQFKRNMLGLPYHENALIMRTSATYPHNNDYRYSVQPMHVFRAWLEHPKGRSVKAVTQRVPVEHPEHFPFVIDDRLPTPE